MFKEVKWLVSDQIAPVWGKTQSFFLNIFIEV